ncbi:MAG: DUF1963 domain-containing protein [Christensenellales bacterium]
MTSTIILLIANCIILILSLIVVSYNKKIISKFKQIEKSQEIEITKDEWKNLQSIMEKSAIYFTSQTEKSFNKIGGKPNLPNDLDWPTCNGTPLSFIAQIDLSTLPQNNGIIPNTSGAIFIFGILVNDCFFGDEENGQQAYKLLYSQNINAKERNFPKKLDKEAQYEANYITPQNIIKELPETVGYGFELKNVNLTDKSIDNYNEYYEAYINKQNTLANLKENETLKFGGYETPMQSKGRLMYNNKFAKHDTGANDLANNIAENDWILLCEIKSNKDKNENMYIGDAGIIYVYIKQSDLINCNFENVFIEMQCG